MIPLININFLLTFLKKIQNIREHLKALFFISSIKTFGFLTCYSLMGSTDLGEGQLTGVLAAASCCNSGSGDPIFGLADFTLEAGLGQSMGVFVRGLGVLGLDAGLIGASLGLARVMGSGFTAPDLEPLTATLEAVMGSRVVMGSRGLGGMPSNPLSASRSALIGSGSGTCWVRTIHLWSLIMQTTHNFNFAEW